MKYYDDYISIPQSNQYKLHIEHYNKNIAYIINDDGEKLYSVSNMKYLNRSMNGNSVQVEVQSLIKEDNIDEDNEVYYNEFDSDDDITPKSEKEIEYLNVKIINNLSIEKNYN